MPRQRIAPRSFQRTPHGSGASALARLELPPVDELSEGVPGASQAPVVERDGKGRYVAGEGARAAAQHAARQRKGNTALASTLAVDSSDPDFKAKLRQAESFRRAHVHTLMTTVGGGVADAAVQASVASAALALAGSRYAYSKGELMLGARLAAEARQHLVAAHELAVRAAAARERAHPSPFLARMYGQQAPAPWRPSSASPAGQDAPDGQPEAVASEPEDVGAVDGQSSNQPSAVADLDPEPDEDTEP